MDPPAAGENGQQWPDAGPPWLTFWIEPRFKLKDHGQQGTIVVDIEHAVFWDAVRVLLHESCALLSSWDIDLAEVDPKLREPGQLREVHDAAAHVGGAEIEERKPSVALH